MVVLLLLGAMTAPVAKTPLEVATDEAATVTTLVKVVGMQVEMVKVLKIGAGDAAAGELAGTETPAANEAAAGELAAAETPAADEAAAGELAGAETPAAEEAAAGVETAAGDEMAAEVLTAMAAVDGAAMEEGVGMVFWAAALLSEAATGQ